MRSGPSSSPTTPISCPSSRSWQAAETELRINLSDGKTHSIQLPQRLDDWLAQAAEPGYQARIRGLSVFHAGALHCLPVPSAFKQIQYMVEVGQDRNGAPASIRASVQADEVLATMTVYLGSKPPMVRFDVRRTGKRRWSAG